MLVRGNTEIVNATTELVSRMTGFASSGIRFTQIFTIRRASDQVQVMQTNLQQFVILIATGIMLAGCNKPAPNEPNSIDQPMSTLDNHFEDRAIATFVRKGGNITVDEDGEVVSLEFYDTTFSSAELQCFSAFPKLMELNLSTCEVDDSIWLHLREMSTLKSLTLWRAAITDAGMENLSHLSTLESLDIRQTQIGDAGLAHVTQLKSLKHLDLLGTDVTGDGLQHVSALTNLKELCLVQTVVSDDALKHILGLRQLTELSLEGSRITNDGLVHVGQLPNLELLTIHDTGITELGLVHLEGLFNLHTLYLCVPVSGIGVRSLRKMAALEHLYLGDVEADSRAFLQSELSGVGVY